jgi:acetyl-CoA acetyltransferase
LPRNGVDIEQVGCIELNAAFAAQTEAVIRRLKLDRKIVNPNGDGISLTHPLGMTGARILGTAAYELAMHDYEYAVAMLCIGGGMGGGVLLKKYRQTDSHAEPAIRVLQRAG